MVYTVLPTNVFLPLLCLPTDHCYVYTVGKSVFTMLVRVNHGGYITDNVKRNYIHAIQGINRIPQFFFGHTYFVVLVEDALRK